MKKNKPAKLIYRHADTCISGSASRVDSPYQGVIDDFATEISAREGGRMGMFDRVWVDCPRCGVDVEFQSKGARFPGLDNFRVDTAPPEVLADLHRDVSECKACGCQVRATIEVKLTVEPD